jgi:hypothetical protein
MRGSRRTEGSPARDEELAQSLGPRRKRPAPPTSAFAPSSTPTGPMLEALQAASGNSAVLRLIDEHRREVSSELRLLVDDARAIDGALQGPQPTGVVQRQPQPAPAPTAEEKPVDPAVKAMWASAVVAPLTKAAESAAGATIQDQENLLRETYANTESARASVKTTAAAVKDDPTLKARLEVHDQGLRRVGNMIVALVSPQSITFDAISPLAQAAAAKAAEIGGKLPAATPPEGSSPSPSTSVAIIRALWKSNVTAKLQPLAGQLKKGAQPQAASALAAVDSAHPHVFPLVDAYATAGNDKMAYTLAAFGQQLADLKNNLMFLAEGKTRSVDDVAKDVEKRKVAAEAVFP